MNESFSLYIHTFPNDKKYIGITSQRVEQRWNNGQGYKTCKFMNRAIKKYGWKNIKHEVIFTNIGKEEACRLEIEMIKKYDSTNIKKGYNISEGGNRNFCFLNKHHTNESKIKNALSQKHKNILCIETNIQYLGIKDAYKKTGIDYSGLSKCCKGKYKTFGGFHWKYVESEVEL